jgi:Protein of unknown function (DUF1453)
MTQQQAINLFLPILIILPVLYFRVRKMARAQPLKLDRLWVRPALVLAIAALALLAPAPAHHPIRVLMPLDWAWLGLAAVLGAVAGWQWGRTMAIDVHPEDGTLMVRGGQAAILVLAVLVVFRIGLRAGLSAEAQAWHLNMLLVSDASIVFSALLFTLRSVEMYLRARRVMALKGAA